LVVIEDRSYVIETKYREGGNTLSLQWTYNPFYRIPLRYYSSSVTRINKNTKSEERLNTVPWYAKEDSNGYMVYRDIIPHGESDPVTEQGVDFPFVNNRHYVFSDIVFSVQPFLAHGNTNNVFSTINFNLLSIMNRNNDLNNINPDC